jgi:hypothetical protein
MKWCIRGIDLQVKMWSGRDAGYSDSSQHIALSDLGSLGDNDLREMEVGRVEGHDFSTHWDIVMADDDKLIAGTIGFGRTDHNTMSDR